MLAMLAQNLTPRRKARLASPLHRKETIFSLTTYPTHCLLLLSRLKNDTNICAPPHRSRSSPDPDALIYRRSAHESVLWSVHEWVHEWGRWWEPWWVHEWGRWWGRW